jgi:catechol 2,3-dioxygenase-like lactoylglutathione lyase family enzyme
VSVRRTAVKAIGEVAIRVNDLDGMRRFYEEVIGLEVMRRFPKAVFFRITDGYKGHVQALVLFDRRGEPGGPRIHRSTPAGVSQERSTLDHIAFEIDLSSYQAERQRLERLGLSVESVELEWAGWRSLYIKDPEGNTVEFVCFDPSIRGEAS